MDGYSYDIGKLKKRAMELGWPMCTVAKKARVAAITVSKMFRTGNGTPSTVKKVAEALGVPMAELVIVNERVAG